MTFLETDVINFRGAHIHALMTELDAAGLPVEGYNERACQQPLMVDEEGVPLPENECGHFTVHDPDGHELFFNTGAQLGTPTRFAPRWLPPRSGCPSPSQRCAFSPLAVLRLLPWGLPLLVERALPATKMRYRKDKAICDPAH